jgi:hypothetical protein
MVAAGSASGAMTSRTGPAITPVLVGPAAEAAASSGKPVVVDTLPPSRTALSGTSLLAGVALAADSAS